ncbi:MAG: hypothetical protein VB997_02740, partial [Opitutales bacterium]
GINLVEYQIGRLDDFLELAKVLAIVDGHDGEVGFWVLGNVQAREYSRSSKSRRHTQKGGLTA